MTKSLHQLNNRTGNLNTPLSAKFGNGQLGFMESNANNFEYSKKPILFSLPLSIASFEIILYWSF
jgi:hypothetical protein